MKKFTAWMLCLSFLFACSGCSAEKAKFNKPVNFYYPIAAGDHQKNDQIISIEIREAASFSDDLLDFTNSYLDGPQSPALISCFPPSAEAIGIIQNQNRLIVNLNEKFSRMSGIELTVAASCLSMTLMEYTNTDEVAFYVKDRLLNGQKTLIFSREIFTLVDEASPDAITNDQ